MRGVPVSSNMKILVADDEKLTRDGLIESVNWQELGIDEVLSAANGAEALDVARKNAPDIVLTDVRMPRLSGIDMAVELRKLYPDTAIIFMSGYSDKEYLKAAIKLSAVSYVEKPIEIREVEEAVRDAISLLGEKQLVERGASLQEMDDNKHLVEWLMRSQNSGEVMSLPEELASGAPIASVILQFDRDAAPLPYDFVVNAQQEFNKYLASYKTFSIYGQKDNRHFCLFMYGFGLTDGRVRSFSGKLRELYSPAGSFTMAVGSVVSSLKKAYQSYNEAVVLSQQSFYCPENSDLFAGENDVAYQPVLSDHTRGFYDALVRRDEKECRRILEEVRGQFVMPCVLLPSQARDIYYKLFMSLQRAAEQARILAFLGDEGDSIFDRVDGAKSVIVLDEMLRESVEEYLKLSEEETSGNSMVFAIEEFVHRNFQNESLSVKTISDHVNRSTSYVCTLFKNETGQTLNQFITKYRLDCAVQMLGDPRYKVTEIAAKCGYSDVNYFGKIFKKYMGCSPTEYRGKAL